MRPLPLYDTDLVFPSLFRNKGPYEVDVLITEYLHPLVLTHQVAILNYALARRQYWDLFVLFLTRCMLRYREKFARLEVREEFRI